MKYTWIKDDDVTKKDLFQKVPSMQVLTTYHSQNQDLKGQLTNPTLLRLALV